MVNGTTSNTELQSEGQGKTNYLAVSLLILIAFLGTIGNLLVLKAIFSLKKRKLHEYLILNLAATDAGICLVSIPLDIAEQLIGGFPYGAALCHVIYPFQSVLVYVSVLTLLFMSLERYRLIVTPMKPTVRVKTGLIIIAVIWVASCLIVLPFSLALKLTGTECSEQWPHAYSGKVFTLTIFTFLYLVPLSIMTVFYSFMIHVLYKDSKVIKLRRNISLSQASTAQRLRRNVKIVKVFAVAVVVFALCMLPTHISWLWHDFGFGSTSPKFTKVVTFSNIFMYANSLLDPFIFGTIDVKTLAKLFRALVCCHPGRQESRRGLGQVFSLRIRSPSLPVKFSAHGTIFRSLSRASEFSHRGSTGTQITVTKHNRNSNDVEAANI